MKNRIALVLLLLALFMVMLPYGPVAAEGENLSLPGDNFNLWLWVALCAVGVIGFLVALFFLLLPAKRGKYERIEKSHKKQASSQRPF